MKSQDDISKKVDETFKVLERINKVDPGPYFYPRLVAKMERLNGNAQYSKLSLKLKYAFFGLVFLLAINGYSIYKMLPLSNMNSNPTMENFIENYQLEVSNIYTINENDIN